MNELRYSFLAGVVIDLLLQAPDIPSVILVHYDRQVDQKIAQAFLAFLRIQTLSLHYGGQ